MATEPMNIVVGGSLAGLMQGVALKRAGQNVTIIEQHTSSAREDQAAGIVAMDHSQAFMKRYDLLQEQPFAVKCTGVQVLDQDLNVVRGYSAPLMMTSWNVLYYRLRANFDGLQSTYCGKPPKTNPGDGSAVYLQGKRVTNLHCQDGFVRVDVEGASSSAQTVTTIQADLVIAADGSTSSMRSIVEPHLQRSYAGYVAWRGTVLEEHVSQQTRDTFQLKTTLHTSKGGYIAVYTIPGENGSIEPGKRLFNFVWYTNMPETSEELDALMTEDNGHRHRNTLPKGKMKRAVWDSQRHWADMNCPAPFAELANKCTRPFISVISDIAMSRASFFDGKLLFVGDALAPFRPHVACSANQAALDALLLEKLVKKEISLGEWERRVMGYAHLTRLRSITWGAWYQSGFVSFAISKVNFWLATGMAWLWRRWYGDYNRGQGWI